ncbi:MAG: leucyl aminopeptidase family protein [Patescibacteria group bacterium]|nr:leucyl aminopeptidase family protein [Patescibacteria group bacterium]
MKIEYTVPKGAASIDLIAGDTTKVIEDHKGTTVLKLGIGKSDEITRRTFISLTRKAVKTAKEQRLSTIAFSFKDFQFPALRATSDRELGRLLGENLEMANYEFTKYKTPPHGGFQSVETVYISDATGEAKKGIAEGQMIAQEIHYCRDLANTPGGDMTPTSLAEAAKRQLRGTAAEVSILSLSDIKKLKMGLVLGVAKGSAQEPKFIIAEYWGAGKAAKEKPIVLVGKGITFDTGGINLKPSDSLMGMNHDMAGGASVIAATAIAAKMKMKRNVVALVPAVENAISGSSYLPGDILRAMNGTFVEVLNTDAEGRLILGDALTYAERYSPRLVVDVATLTGAALIALGKRASAIMTKNQELEDLLRRLGEESGEYVWPFPLWKEYETDLKSAHADIANVPASKGTGGGTIQGGIFLARFAANFPRWAHIDIAPRMESIPEDHLAKGATGAPVRLLVRLIENF